MRAPSSIARFIWIPCLWASSSIAAEKVTYDDHILPIFENSCTNCHNPDKKKGGLDLSSYSAAMAGGSGGKIAIAGEGGDSRIFLTATHSEEPFMPPKGDKLTKKELTAIRAWIDGGLLETKDSKVKKNTQTKISFQSSNVGKPDGPPPMPENLSVEPVVTPTTSTAIHAMTSSPWAPLLAITGQSQVLLYHSDSLELIGILPFPKRQQPTALAFHPSGTYLTAAGGTPGKSGTTVTWDITSGKVVAQTAREYDSILTTSMRVDMQAVATGGPSKLVKTWATADNSIEHSIKKHTDWVTALSFSNDGVLLASADRNGGMWVWEAYSGQQLHNLRGHQGFISQLDWSADSNFLASASADGSVRFWNMNTGKQVKKVDAHKGGVVGFDWAKDGHFLTSGRDKKIKLWKPDYKLIKEWNSPTRFITHACFSHDAKRFYTADFDGRVFAWDSKSFKQVGEVSTIPASIATRLSSAIQTHSRLSSATSKAEQARAQSESNHKKFIQRHKQAQQQLASDQNESKELDSKINHADKQLKTTLREFDHAEKKCKQAENHSKLKLAENQKSHIALQLAEKEHHKKCEHTRTLHKELDTLTAKLAQAEADLQSQPDNSDRQKARELAQKKLTKKTQEYKKSQVQELESSKTLAHKNTLAQAAAESKKLAEIAHQKELATWKGILKRKQELEARSSSLKKRKATLRKSIPEQQKSLPHLAKQRDAEKAHYDQLREKAKTATEKESIALRRVATLQKAQENERLRKK